MQSIIDALAAKGFKQVVRTDDVNILEFEGRAVLTANGLGLYSCPKGLIVTAEYLMIEVTDNNITHIGVTHDVDEDGFEVYTDPGMELGVSELLGFPVCFTESGMQDEHMMSMEPEVTMNVHGKYIPPTFK